MLSHKVENRLAEEQFANKYAKKLQRTHKRVQKEIDTIFAKAQKNGQWSRQEIYKYNRAKKLKSTIREQLGKYKGNFAKEFRDDLSKLYKNETRWMQNFLKEQKGLGIAYENMDTGLPVQAVKSEVVDNIMIKGKTMTEYVGKYGDDVAFKVEQEVMDSIMLGEHPSQTTARLNKLTNKMQNRVDMTVRSWTNAVWNKSNLDVYEQAEIKKVRYLATFDEKTCSECADLHDRVFSLTKGEEPNLPLHPYCRCAYAPYISEELTPSAGDMPTEEVKKSDEVKFKPYESEEEWRNGISASHKDAIHWWTDTGHRDIRAYQSGAKSMAEVDGMTPEALDFINEAMAKAPDYKGTVYRGLADLPNNVKNLYMKEGANVSFKAHSSTSMKLGEAENFVADPSGSLILKIHTKSGTDIHNLSEYSSELEVLLKKGTQFKTKGVVGETRGFKIVEWVEV